MSLDQPETGGRNGGGADAPADNVTYIQRVQKRDLEEILADNLTGVFGERFTAYRRQYKGSLNPPGPAADVPEFPLTVGFEMVNRCNLSCVMCYTVNHTAPKSALSEDQISAVLAEGRKNSLPAVIIGLGSEPLLYKKIRDVFTAVRDAGVMDVFLNTNGVLLTPELSEFLVETGVTRVQVSLDAATRETFKAVRGKDELDLIEGNIRALADARLRAGKELPVIRVSFCVQDINAHEREAFTAKWRDTVDYVDFQALSDFDYVDEVGKTGEIERLKDTAKHTHLKETHCPLPFNSLHVWANGDITPCCVFYGKNLVMGNINEQTLEDVWNGAPIRALRQEFVDGNLNPNCRICLAERDHDLLEGGAPEGAPGGADGANQAGRAAE